MERKAKYEKIGWVEFDDYSIDKTMADLSETIETAKSNGYFDIEFEDGGITVYGKRHETDDELLVRQKSEDRKAQAVEREALELYKKLKKKFDPIFQSIEFST